MRHAHFLAVGDMIIGHNRDTMVATGQDPGLGFADTRGNAGGYA